MSAVTADERLASSSSPLSKVLKRPELGAIVAALAVMIFFSVYTSAFMTARGIGPWLESSSSYGIMAVAVALLMIGGEFDLSAGAMTGFTALVVGILTTHWNVNIWVSLVVALVLALAIGALNGFLVMKTGLPSFIVTLGSFFVLQGVDLAVTKAIIGQVSIQGMSSVPGYETVQRLFGSSFDIGGGGSIYISFVWWIAIAAVATWTLLRTRIGQVSIQGMSSVPGYETVQRLFGSSFDIGGGGSIYISFVWWIAIAAVATWTLLRTRIGNWIFAVGGAQLSARQIGVPVLKTKVGLFMGTAAAGWLVGMISLFRTSTVQATTGVGDEFIYIICAVVGGCLLTGGYGSAIGASCGALIYGMTYNGIAYANWDTNWLKAVLGVMLLGAVLVNNWIRIRAERSA